MSGKKISIGVRPGKTHSDADAWVENRFDEETKSFAEKMKRLTIDIPESLHKAVKSTCAMRGTRIADEIRALLYEKYGKS